MTNRDKTKQQLIEELAEMRRRLAAAEAAGALLDRDQRAALILQAAQLGIHECDTKGRITFVNPSQEKIMGYSAEELLGTYVWDRVEPGTLRESLPAYLRQLVVEQPPPMPYVAKNIRNSNCKRRGRKKGTGTAACLWTHNVLRRFPWRSQSRFPGYRLQFE